MSKFDEYEHPEKVKALMKWLREDQAINLNFRDDVIEENDNEYTINPRQTYYEKSPRKIYDQIQRFKSLLHPPDRRSIEFEIRHLQHIQDEINECIKEREEATDAEHRGEAGTMLGIFERAKTATSKANQELYDTLKTRLPQDEELKREFLYMENILYHLILNPEKYGNTIRQAWFRVPDEYRHKSYTDDGRYLVLTDDEADDYARSSLIDDPEMWKQAVEAGSTEQSLEDWTDDVLNSDGRGAILNSWNGVEYSIDLDGTWYYIYGGK